MGMNHGKKKRNVVFCGKNMPRNFREEKTLRRISWPVKWKEESALDDHLIRVVACTLKEYINQWLIRLQHHECSAFETEYTPPYHVTSEVSLVLLWWWLIDLEENQRMIGTHEYVLLEPIMNCECVVLGGMKIGRQGGQGPVFVHSPS